MDKNTFALRAPRGWNSYDYYDTTVDEKAVRANAEYMAKHMKEGGWEYIVIDIEWFAPGAGKRRSEFQYIPFDALVMDKYARLQPDPARFPSSKGGKGFAPLAKYIHSLGLKFGIHIMRGIPREAAHRHIPTLSGVDAAEIANPSSICGWNPDMYGVKDTPAGQAYYDSLMELYAQWGVDFIKCDDICNTNIYPHNPYSAKHEIEMLAKAIDKCGRPIVLSLSPGPALIEQAWHYEKYANMWRITDDFWDRWDLLKDMFRRCEIWQNHVSVGNYPDCDMLPVGELGKGFGGDGWHTRFTQDEQRTMLTLWNIFGAPLMIGTDLTTLDKWTFDLLNNAEILAMNDPAFRPLQLFRTDDAAAWISTDGKDYYVALFNLSDKKAKVSVSAEELLSGLWAKGMKEPTLSGSYLSLWTEKTVEAKDGALSISLPAHGTVALKPQ
ncbi:MAG: glycoside hydrolase family 27 protein [Lachnospiraceae bacterium]|nr:glycoside hydrolase family 27 protein [Lachnospiraceae bacterium]